MGIFPLVGLGDDFAAQFLIESGADVNSSTTYDKITPLHLAATFNPDIADAKVMEGMAEVTALLLAKGASANAQDNEG